tara:strand:- start:208 stop:432 length:225 start_codon:yes stop_codon:yes gene_type:complete
MVNIKKLDLHGVRHHEVERLVENFVLLNEPPLEIICGNSNRMMSIVEFKLGEIQQKHFNKMIIDSYSWGVIKIL